MPGHPAPPRPATPRQQHCGTAPPGHRVARNAKRRSEAGQGGAGQGGVEWSGEELGDRGGAVPALSCPRCVASSCSTAPPRPTAPHRAPRRPTAPHRLAAPFSSLADREERSERALAPRRASPRRAAPHRAWEDKRPRSAELPQPPLNGEDHRELDKKKIHFTLHRPPVQVRCSWLAVCRRPRRGPARHHRDRLDGSEDRSVLSTQLLGVLTTTTPTATPPLS